MKKILALACLLAGITTTGMAQSPSTENTDKPTVPATPATQKVEDYQATLALVRFGYANKHALSLIAAADLIYRLNVTPLPADARTSPAGSPAADGKTNKPDLANAAQLLTDARALAKGDATLLALADRVKPTPAARGAVGGSKRTTTRVMANSTDSFTVRFYGQESAIVALSGDGDTDLDLYVYDGNGNFIGSDDDNTDDCVVRWIPRYTGSFTIRVKNRGSIYNQYTMATN